MKKKKISLIVTICLTVAMAIATVLCFVIPIFAQKKDAPVEVSQTIKLEYKSVNNVRAYYLVGKIRNKSDKPVSFKDNGGLKVYFNGSDDVADNWLGVDEIELLPGEEFDLSVGVYYFRSSGVSVSKVSIKIDGTTYFLVGRESGSIASILGVVFIIMTITMLIVTIALAKQNKTGARRAEILAEACNRLGGDCVVITGTVTDKSESKKAAAKTAGWVLGGALAALFTGVGFYRVYSGTSQKQFIINKNSLYLIQDSDMTGDNLLKITPENYAVDSITVKKKTVIMKTADKKQTVKFITNKKSPLTAEQLYEYLNDIFIKKVAVDTVESVPAIDEVSTEDPFTDLQPEVAATDDVAAQVNEKASNENEDKE